MRPKKIVTAVQVSEPRIVSPSGTPMSSSGQARGKKKEPLCVDFKDIAQIVTRKSQLIAGGVLLLLCALIVWRLQPQPVAKVVVPRPTRGLFSRIVSNALAPFKRLRASKNENTSDSVLQVHYSSSVILDAFSTIRNSAMQVAEFFDHKSDAILKTMRSNALKNNNFAMNFTRDVQSIVANATEFAVVAVVTGMGTCQKQLEGAIDKLRPSTQRDLLTLVSSRDYAGAKQLIANTNITVLTRQDLLGKTVLHQVLHHKYKETATGQDEETDRDDLIIQMLTKVGSAGLCNFADVLGNTCLHLIARHNDAKLLKSVLKLRVPLAFSKQTISGATALQIALRYEHDKVAVLLISKTDLPNTRVPIFTF